MTATEGTEATPAPTATEPATPAPSLPAAATPQSTGDRVLDAALVRYDQIRPKIRPEVLKPWGEFVTKHKSESMSVPRMKGIFADCFLLPAIQLQKTPDEFALRAATAQIRGLLDSAYFDYEILITSVGNVQQASEKKTEGQAASSRGKVRDWRIRGFAIARCADPKNEFFGPASLMTFNYATEAEAKREAAKLVPGRFYRYRGRPMKDSPRGTLGPGKVGVVHGSAQEPKLKEIPIPAVPVWKGAEANPTEFGFDMWAKAIPRSPVKLPLGSPENYAAYHCQGEKTKGFVGQTKDGEMTGSISIRDSSIQGALDDKFPTGLNVFLAKHDVPKGKLLDGSVVSIIFTMSKSKKKDAAGARTGEDIWGGNEIAMRVDLDLSSGTSPADPDAEAVSVAAPGAEADVGDARDIV